jgi:predicted transcriptional regulator YdeE
MRKWLLVTSILLLALGSIYWFIPAELKIVQITPVHCPAPAAYRAMAEDDTLLGNQVRIIKKLHNTLEVQIGHINSTINLVPLPHDSCAIQWTCHLNSGINPITRIKRYRQAVTIKNNMDSILNSFRTWAEQKDKLYGIPLQEKTFTDTTLIATKTTTTIYPGVKEIYSLIHSLKNYSAGFQAKQTSYPLLNITPLANGGYQVLAALPVDKTLPDKGAFFKRKIPLNKFLFTTVQGSDAAVQHTFKQLQLYISDHRKTVMAVPFQVLVTDRSVERDSSKWITHIYVPVF